MRQIKIGDITIDAVIERDGPWRKPEDFFPDFDEATFQAHVPKMEPEVFDPTTGKLVMTYQTFVIRTPISLFWLIRVLVSIKAIRHHLIFPAKNVGGKSYLRLA